MLFPSSSLLQAVPTIKSIELLKVQIPNEDKSKSVFEYKVVSPTIKTCDSLGANFDWANQLIPMKIRWSYQINGI